MDQDLFDALYLIFVDMIKWCVRHGKTEHNACLAAGAALRAVGVDIDTVVRAHRQYVAGS